MDTKLSVIHIEVLKSSDGDTKLVHIQPSVFFWAQPLSPFTETRTSINHLSKVTNVADGCFDGHLIIFSHPALESAKSGTSNGHNNHQSPIIQLHTPKIGSIDPPQLPIPPPLKTQPSRPSVLLLPMSLLILISLLLVLLFLYFLYKPPFLLLRYFQFHYPSILFHIPLPHSKKLIALTIDDAPSQYTQEIMEILANSGATATFFVIGSQVPGQEDTLRDIVRNGHELGNHTMYDEASISLNDETLVSQIKSVEKIIDQAYTSIGKFPPASYFRPGSGFFHARMRRIVQRLGYRMVLGSIYPHDAQIAFWRVNAWHILSMLRPGDIVICHDRRKWTAPMLWMVLPEMRLRGYRAVSVSQLLDEARG